MKTETSSLPFNTLLELRSTFVAYQMLNYVEPVLILFKIYRMYFSKLAGASPCMPVLMNETNYVILIEKYLSPYSLCVTLFSVLFRRLITGKPPISR